MRFLPIILLVLSFSSCKTAMLYTTLDVLRPAQVEFAPDVENLLIVNNSAIQPVDSGHTVRLFNGKPQSISVSTDSVALFCLSVLADEIESTDFFSMVDLHLESLRKNQDFKSLVPLQRETVKNLCEMYDADAVLSLDHVVVRDEVVEHYDYDWGMYLALLAVRHETLWSIHYPGRVGVTAVHFKDSLFWESEAYNRKKALEELPDRQDAIIDGALSVGQNAAKRFIPYWEKSDRYFYDSNNKLMKQGMDSVYVKNWKGAIALWEQVFYTSNKSNLKAQAANNIAIAYEITENYDKALEFVKIAIDIFNSKIVVDNETLVRLSDYTIELYRRKREIEKLNRQLGE